MKTSIVIFTLLFSVHVFAQTESKKSSDKTEYSKEVTVNGMVCAFCANSLEKKFKKQKAVEKIKVKLENKKVSVKFKKGQSIKDKELKRIITSSGFSVVNIKSLKQSKVSAVKEKNDQQ